MRRAAAVRGRTGCRLLALLCAPMVAVDPPMLGETHRAGRAFPAPPPPESSTVFFASRGGHGEHVRQIRSHRHLRASPAVHAGYSCSLNRAKSVFLLICSLLEEKQRIDTAEEYCSFQFATICLHHGHSVSFSLNGGKHVSKMRNMLSDDGIGRLMLMWPHT